ncbi:hypothetical protein BOX15_Mlig002275g1, partial [Macrostomum lignano]
KPAMSTTEEGVSADILESEMAAAKAASSAEETAGAASLEDEATKELEAIPVQGSNRECTFILRNEDHTLGNALRCTLMRNPRVSFAGCSVPHPLTKEIHLRIVTVSDDVAPADCLAEGLRDLYASAESLLHQFDSAYDEFVASNESAAGDGADVKINIKQEFMGSFN